MVGTQRDSADLVQISPCHTQVLRSFGARHEGRNAADSGDVGRGGGMRFGGDGGDKGAAGCDACGLMLTELSPPIHARSVLSMRARKSINAELMGSAGSCAAASSLSCLLLDSLERSESDPSAAMRKTVRLEWKAPTAMAGPRGGG